MPASAKKKQKPSTAIVPGHPQKVAGSLPDLKTLTPEKLGFYVAQQSGGIARMATELKPYFNKLRYEFRRKKPGETICRVTT